jgi:hypothetical protein
MAIKVDGFVKSPSVPPWRDYCAVHFMTFYEVIKVNFDIFAMIF